MKAKKVTNHLILDFRKFKGVLSVILKKLNF